MNFSGITSKLSNLAHKSTNILREGGKEGAKFSTKRCLIAGGAAALTIPSIFSSSANANANTTPTTTQY